jgi:hypothetical protein
MEVQISLVSVVLSDVRVSKGFEDKPQARFNASEGQSYGFLSFKVSHKKQVKEGEKAAYDNYTIDCENVKKDSKLIEILNRPGVRVCVLGKLSQEVYKDRPFMKVKCHSSDLSISNFADAETAKTAAAPPVDDDPL